MAEYAGVADHSVKATLRTHLHDRMSVRRAASGPRWGRLFTFRAIVADATAGLLAVLAALAFRFGDSPGAESILFALAIPVLWIGSVALSNGYATRNLGTGPEEYRTIVRAGVKLAAATAFFSYITKAELARGFVLVAIPTLTIAALLFRWALRTMLYRQRERGLMMARVVVVGREDSVSALIRQIKSSPADGMNVVAACVSGIDGPYHGEVIEGVPVHGTPEQVLLAVMDYDAEVVAVSSHPDLVGHSLRRLGWALEGRGVELVVDPGIVEVSGPRLTLRPTAGLPLLHVERPIHSGVRVVAKTVLDRLAGLLLILLASPLLIGLAIAIKIDSRGPVLFRQTRVGAHGETFSMVKFRSMVTDAEALLAALGEDHDGNDVLFKMRNDPRVTRVGRFIRRYSLDELPQLINVVRGEMSLIGPRPPLPSEVATYESDAVRRLHVRPGMTGLWQVSGRSDLSWEDSLRLDLWYVDNWTPILDMQIIVRTAKAVLRGSGAY